ncbi:MAG: hypothetical protein LBV72_02125 [Tannerella sp.]|jgi:hypothetical protein|nr:hypothetical protein [Tannerella sp.]
MKQRNILYTIACTLFIISGLYGCIDDPEFDSGVRNADVPKIGELIISGRDKTASTITLKSSVLQANGYPVTERGFMWNTDSVIPENDKDKQLQVGEGIGEYTDTIKNLSPGVLYYFWSYARNEINVSYSRFDSTSTMSGLGRIKTYFVEEDYKYATHAIVSGKINLQGEGKTISRGVYYSKKDDWENKIPLLSKTSLELDSFVCELSDLKPETYYIVQAFVTNEISDTEITTLGDTVSFQTGDGKPVVDKILQTKPDYSTVFVESRIISQGDTLMDECGFCWGLTSDLTIDVDSVVRLEVKEGTLSTTIENLVPEQQYFVRAYGKNKFGISYSDPKDFFMQKDKPTLQTLDPSYDYDAGTVFVNGLINNPGKSDITVRGICYSSTVPVPDIINSKKIIITTTDDNFSDVIAGLKGGTKYYIRAFATNGEGTSYGAVKDITTPDILKESSDEFGGSARFSGSSAYFAIGDKGYLLGGDRGSSITDELYSYNAVSGSWKDLKLCPASAKWQAVAVYGNSAYVLGGLGKDNKCLNNFYEYNASLINLWSNKPKGPDSAYLRVGVTLADEAYFIGGVGVGDSVKDEVWAYDFISNVWIQKPAFPVKQYGGIALNVKGEIYTGMGKDTVGVGVCNNTIWKLNADLSTWTQETDNSLISKGVLAGVVYNDKIYLIDESFYIHEYDLSSKTWTRKSRINGNDQDVHGMFVINDKIYIGLINKKMYMYNPLWDND